MAQISNRAARARAAMELKLSILSALTKLGDRDTQQMAVEELQRIADNLPAPDGIAVFLGCLFDIGPEHKPAVRKECTRLLAAMSAIHGESLSPHLPKMVAFLVRRLKDHDTQIRDVVVETMGVLVARVPAAESSATTAATSAANAGSNAFLVVYTKPLFDAMGEQTKSVQVGASMCLARVIENAANLSPACVHRLAPRIVKVLSSPGFMAKAALLSAIGSLSRVAKDSGDEHLAQLVPCVQEALHSNDWTARKAAAETLSVLACPGLSKLKPSTLGVLDSYRFDKVKPVRDAVTCAIHVWKTVPGPELDSSLKLRSTNNNVSEETPSFSRCWKEPEADAENSGGDAAKSYEQAESVSSDEKSSTKAQSRKKAPTVSDLKTNPDFFRKLESKISDDWEVEVAVPRASPSQDAEGKSGSDKEFVSAEADSRTTVSGEADCSSSRRSRTPVESENYSEATSVPEGGSGIATASAAVADAAAPTGSGLAIKSSSAEETVSWLDAQQRESEQEQEQEKSQHWDGDPEPASIDARLNGRDWILIQRQICQLERGQTELLEMLQDFMCTCQESMLSLQDRVQRLERSVENISSSGRNSGGGGGVGVGSSASGRTPATATHEFTSRNRNFADPRETPTTDALRFLKLSDYEERFSVQSDRSGRESPFSSSIQELRASMNYDSLRSVVRGDRSETSRQQQLVESIDDQPPATRRAWDRGSGSVRSGEGPSARSVWRASKDEATLEAIRVAAGEEAVSSEKSPVIESKLPDSKQASPPSWLFWTRAMENLHGGDVDSAYEEALSAEDDLLLVRMMNQTGPAFDHFSTSTAISMFRALLQILHQQHFLDAAFPWLDQVAELVRSNGADCFKFTMDVKRELVTSLHDTSALDFPERWMGNAVAKLALQLATAWSIDLLD